MESGSHVCGHAKEAMPNWSAHGVKPSACWCRMCTQAQREPRPPTQAWHHTEHQMDVLVLCSRPVKCAEHYDSIGRQQPGSACWQA